MTALLLAALVSPAHAVSDCYWDQDDDGYLSANPLWDGQNTWSWSAATAACEEFFADSVPDRFRFDCDDSDPAVHPRRNELANGRDDNCNGKIDEPTFSWPSAPTASTRWETGVRITVYPKDQSTLDRAAQHGDVQARVSYRPLYDTAWQETVLFADELAAGNFYEYLTIEGLEPGTPYQIEVQFEYGLGVASGARSESFFAITTDAGSDLVNDARARIVTRAFYHYYRSNAGYLGYEGTTSGWLDGTEFGAALSTQSNENMGLVRWCTEAYVGFTQDEIDDTLSYATPVNGSGGIPNISTLAGWWSDPAQPWNANIIRLDPLAEPYCGEEDGSCTAAEVGTAIERYARPGDWVHVSGHSTMFLAYDAVENMVWVIDGNGSYPGAAADASWMTSPPVDVSNWIMDSNVISIRPFKLDEFRGMGRLQPQMQ